MAVQVKSPRPKEEGSLKRAGAKDSEHLIVRIFDLQQMCQLWWLRIIWGKIAKRVKNLDKAGVYIMQNVNPARYFL